MIKDGKVGKKRKELVLTAVSGTSSQERRLTRTHRNHSPNPRNRSSVSRSEPSICGESPSRSAEDFNTPKPQTLSALAFLIPNPHNRDPEEPLGTLAVYHTHVCGLNICL